MSRENAGTDNIGIRVPLVSSSIDNFTMGGWAWLDTTTGDNAVLTHGKDDAGSSFDGITLVVTGGTISFIRNGIAYHNTATSFGTGAWHHILLERNSGTWKIFYDNTDIGPNNTDNPNNPTQHLGIGCQAENNAIKFRNWDGKLAEMAFWERVLTTAEKTALFNGYAPSFFLKNLVFYAPLIRELTDVKSGNTLTNASTTVADHPKIIYPPAPTSFYTPTAAAATSVKDLIMGGIIPFSR